MLRWLTAGESHGPALLATIEGLPAGVEVTTKDVAAALARRRLGFGRGARMKFEQDEVEFLGGRAPRRHAGVARRDPDRQHRVAQVGDRDVPGPGRRTRRSPPPTTSTPRRRSPATGRSPGRVPATPTSSGCRSTASTTPARCSSGPRPARPPPGWRSVRSPPASSSRPTASAWSSHTVAIGTAGVADDAELPTPDQVEQIDADPVRTLDAAGSAAMVAEVEAAKKDGDTLGGVVEVLAYGLPPGLGSHVHWDRRLDAQLAGGADGHPGDQGRRGR